MANPKQVNAGFPCPHCGGLIQIVGTAKAEPLSLDQMDVRAQLLGTLNSFLSAAFTPAQRNHLEATIEGNCAHIEWKGQFNKALWSRVNTEIRGYGGRHVKSHWLLPLAVLKQSEEES